MIDKKDVFGSALLDRLNGNNHPFFFEIGGKVEEHSLYRYFRSSDNLSKSEEKLISICYGDILDVGCGTGNYMTALSKVGNVIGIDISPSIIEVAHRMGITNCQVGDIYAFEYPTKFDTITMFENNIGMGGNVEGVKKLLRKLGTLLKDDGQILIDLSGRAKDNDYIIGELTPIYRDVRGEQFRWISFNKRYLARLCEEIGMSLKVISSNRYYSLVRITKNK